MIEPERVLYYMEHIALHMDDGWWMSEEQKKKFFNDFYMLCHVGTAAMHACQHPDWEEWFLKQEQALIDKGEMKPYHVKKKEIESGVKDPTWAEIFRKKNGGDQPS